MIVVDANLLLYAYNTDARHHEGAKSWLAEVFASTEEVLLPIGVLLAFLRISTDARIQPAPLATEEAAGIVDSWLAYPAVRIPQTGKQHWEILSNLLVEGQCRGPLVMDAEIAALAIEHDAMLCTADRDFARFSGLRVMNPVG